MLSKPPAPVSDLPDRRKKPEPLGSVPMSAPPDHPDETKEQMRERIRRELLKRLKTESQ